VSPILPLRRLSTLSDARLVELTRTGNERAFETLVRRYRRQLLVYAGRLLGAEGRAEDALQQALLRAWIALRDGAEVGEVRAWLYRIVHNSAVSMLRRARHDCVELNEAVDAAAPEGGAESRLVVAELFAGLAALPEPQRQAILLTAGGSSHSEAAVTLGLTDGAVRGLVYRARAAAVLKGGAIMASVGALAGAGQAVLPNIDGPSHRRRAVPGQPARPVRHLTHSDRLASAARAPTGGLSTVGTNPSSQGRGRLEAGLSPRHDAPESGRAGRRGGAPARSNEGGSGGPGAGGANRGSSDAGGPSVAGSGSSRGGADGTSNSSHGGGHGGSADPLATPPPSSTPG
jgi:RNA polymerase sigma factor (sigma-70 family)